MRVIDVFMFMKRFVSAALDRTMQDVTYDGRYLAMTYPNGDVPNSIGVCTDVVIRSYRKIGIDLQRLVHEDMRRHFSLYPNNWGHTRPDTNIDHRRVPNLQTFFTRKGQELDVTEKSSDYAAGDLVTWMLPGNLPHIGIVSGFKSQDKQRPLMIHNVGSGPELSDFLFSFPITGHYRYFPELEDAEEMSNLEHASDLE